LKRILFAIAAAFALAGCNTVEGLGKDIKKGGEAIEKSAERHK
jgi:predicted small secreted protein